MKTIGKQNLTKSAYRKLILRGTPQNYKKIVRIAMVKE